MHACQFIPIENLTNPIGINPKSICGALWRVQMQGGRAREQYTKIMDVGDALIYLTS
jgi:hypothetical protein